MSGAKIATDRQALERHNIHRIVNCALSVVPCLFIDELKDVDAAGSKADAAATGTSTDSTKRFTYLVLNMVDGRQDDIGWFVCQVLQFVGAGQALGQNTLIHCEKGISRYCSFPLLSPSSCGFPRSRGSVHSKQSKSVELCAIQTPHSRVI